MPEPLQQSRTAIFAPAQPTERSTTEPVNSHSRSISSWNLRNTQRMRARKISQIVHAISQRFRWVTGQFSKIESLGHDLQWFQSDPSSSATCHKHNKPGRRAQLCAVRNLAIAGTSQSPALQQLAGHLIALQRRSARSGSRRPKKLPGLHLPNQSSDDHAANCATC